MYHDLRNAIIMRNVIYAECLKEINLTQNKEFTKCRLDYDDKWRLYQTTEFSNHSSGNLKNEPCSSHSPWCNRKMKQFVDIFHSDQMTITSRARFLPLFFLHLSLTGWNEIHKRYTGEIYNTFASIYAVGCLLYSSTTIIVFIPPPLREYSFLSLFEMSSTTQWLFF